MSSPVLDILIAVGLLIGLGRGLSTGAVRQIVGLAGTVLAIVLALELMHPVGNAIGGILGAGASIVPILGFIVVFAAVQLALYVLAKIIETSLKMLRLSMLNRAAGAVFGLCKAALLTECTVSGTEFFQRTEFSKPRGFRVVRAGSCGLSRNMGFCRPAISRRPRFVGPVRRGGPEPVWRHVARGRRRAARGRRRAARGVTAGLLPLWRSICPGGSANGYHASKA